MTVEAVVTELDDARRLVRADGFLTVDGRVIYQMKDFAIRMATTTFLTTESTRRTLRTTTTTEMATNEHEMNTN